MVKEILVVDDQPGIRLLLNDVLTNEGYHVTAVTTGKEAMDLVQKQAFDIIILDYRLPIFNGVDVLQRMAENAIHIPTIMITGMKEAAQKEITKTGLQAEVLGKPFNIADLCTIVSNMIE